MAAAYYASYGPPDAALQMIETHIPAIRKGEVLVEVSAASINPADYKMMGGFFFLVDFLLTHSPGFDVSGKVVAVGTGCQR
eukprot:CAMPEP_0183362562 /NCGR_PEP_ID=MMETSP0164_2-20130417/70118_1 /TAXON_ID=221442 /ORGANISM="Coccolithus pelagicus ssp braarudi, Strain PLY182g" /LENGTH=80 /DNA_ID=CAMNT_0025537457 /DNA_START=39 /DNA_END=278 /DNA_ORIENTATION=+